MIIPNWPAPQNVRAYTTTREGGVSAPPYASFNLAMHVDDNPQHVAQNREHFLQKVQLSQQPIWLNQTHSTVAVELTAATPNTTPQDADASYTRVARLPCTVLTADCLPLLVCNRQGTEIAAIHAGWRGLKDGVIENTIQQLTSKPADLLVWLGPAIGPTALELSNEIRLDFLHSNTQNSLAFKQVGSGWFADIYTLARISLKKVNVENVYGGDYCTFTDSNRFFSYRRDGITGRMASTIWLT